MKLYGIPQCDTVKKAKKWLESQSISYDFHDYKKLGADKSILEKACNAYGWEAVLNKRGTTWRKLDDTIKASVTDAPSAIMIMMEHTSTIKRPIALTSDETCIVGFNENEWKETFNV